jgi:hypothetical protein
MNKNTTAAQYGLMAGVVMIVIILLIYILNAASLGTFLPMVVYLPLLFLMIWGAVTIRKEAGAFSSFGQAFVVIFLISAIATILFDTFGYLLYAVIDTELPEIIKQKVIDNTTSMMEKLGSTDEQIEEALQRIKDQDYTPTLKTQLIRYAMSLGIGAIFSALIALFVARPDNHPSPTKPEA